MPKVSVIVPVYNQEKYIKETLQSIQIQTYTDYECIIVNDGSRDKSSDIIHEFCRRDTRFICYDKKNEGVSIARNYGIQYSSGEYILPVDGDDLIEPSYVEECVEILDKEKKVKVVYCRADKFGAVKGEWFLPDYSIETMLARNCIFCSAMYRRVDYDTTRGYNPNMREGLEDWDFWISLLGYGGEVYKINKILFHYRVRKASRNRNFGKEKRRNLRKQIWMNHREVYANHYLDPTNTLEYFLANKARNSIEYKIGKVVLFPYRKIRKLLGI